MTEESRPYKIVDIMRTILTHQPELMDASEQDVRAAFAEEVAAQGFDNSHMPNDLRRVFFKVKREIEDGILLLAPEEERRQYLHHEQRTDPLAGQDEPFSANKLDYIFQLVAKGDVHLATRESHRLDFKENFHRRSRAEYGKTMAGFANNSGGYLVFGVTDVPHKAVGLSNDEFDKFDPEQMTQFLLSVFAPSIDWDHRLINRENKRFALIYVKQCKSKPIIAVGNGGKDIQEGEVYYRYPGLTKRIKPLDLLRLIEDRIQAQNERWQASLLKMATLTPQGAEILNLVTGRIGDTPILIDQQALEQIKFIREGEFRERSGDPTLKLIGEVKGPEGAVVVPMERPVLIDQQHIINCFLSQKCNEPQECLKYIVNQNTSVLPIWFFIRCSEMPLSEAREFLQSCDTRHANVKTKFLDRLEQGEVLKKHRTSSYLTDLLQDKKWNTATFDADVARIIVEEHPDLNTRQAVSVGRTLVLLSLRLGDLSVFELEFASKHVREVLEGMALLTIAEARAMSNAIMLCQGNIRPLCKSGNDWSRFRHTLCFLDAALFAPDDLVSE